MVLDICERTIIINRGKIEADGPTAEIFQDEKLLADCCLEKPLRMKKVSVMQSFIAEAPDAK